MAKPIIFQEKDDVLQLHGVLALSVDVGYILRELKSLNSSSFNSGSESRYEEEDTCKECVLNSSSFNSGSQSRH